MEALGIVAVSGGHTCVAARASRVSCARAHESLRAERVVRRTIADLGSCVVAFERFWTVLNALFFRSRCLLSSLT